MGEYDHDMQNLKILAIFHYIASGMIIFFSGFFLIYTFIGMFMLHSPERFLSENGSPPPDFVGWLFTGIGFLVFLPGLLFAVCVFLSGRCLVRLRHYIYCMVIAGMMCLWVPFGTVLGVFTIVVLAQDSVKERFLATPDTQRSSEEKSV